MAHFSPIEANELNNPVVGIVQGFNTQMATQFSTFPLERVPLPFGTGRHTAETPF
jgi:hypothetical protein